MSIDHWQDTTGGGQIQLKALVDGHWVNEQTFTGWVNGKKRPLSSVLREGAYHYITHAPEKSHVTLLASRVVEWWGSTFVVNTPTGHEVGVPFPNSIQVTLQEVLDPNPPEMLAHFPTDIPMKQVLHEAEQYVRQNDWRYGRMMRLVAQRYDGNQRRTEKVERIFPVVEE